MRLYIFKARSRPRLYGATRYETPSNLPTQKGNGGWVFHERVDLTPRTRLEYGIASDTIREQVELRGWHVWDETRRARNSAAREPLPQERERLTPNLWTEPPGTVSPPPLTSKVMPVRMTSETPMARMPQPPVRQHPPEKSPPAERPAQKESPVVSSQPRIPEKPERDLSGVVPERAAGSERRVVLERSEVPERRMERSRPEPVRPPRHQVVWFDIPVRDIDRALHFYSAVLGTPIKKERAGPGAATAVLPHSDGSVGGALVQSLDARPSESGPLLYLNTDGRLDEALKTVETCGGKVLAEKHSIAPFGFRAIVLDCEGNRLALHSK